MLTTNENVERKLWLMRWLQSGHNFFYISVERRTRQQTAELKLVVIDRCLPLWQHLWQLFTSMSCLIDCLDYSRHTDSDIFLANDIFITCKKNDYFIFRDGLQCTTAILFWSLISVYISLIAALNIKLWLCKTIHE